MSRILVVSRLLAGRSSKLHSITLLNNSEAKSLLRENPVTRSFRTRGFSQESSQKPQESSSGASAKGPTLRGDETEPSGRAAGSLVVKSSPIVDAALTTFVGIGFLFVGGIAYLAWYKKNVLDKIESAFSAEYDPALDLASHATCKRDKGEDSIDDFEMEEDNSWTEHLRRKEQEIIDRIVHGAEIGHYFVLLGPKGGGKTTMILDAMQANHAEGVAMCDAHPNLEVFRLRLGKALNYEFNEDSQTGLFQRRDPREGGPALDIERALNKLEKVALRSARRSGRPLVLVINNVHYFQNDDEGKHMLLQLQQRAEAWAASGIMTLVFSTDDFWPFFVMRKTASRMQVISIYDLDPKESLHACTRMRLHTGKKMGDPAELKEVISVVGGRLSYLSKVSKARNMVETAKHLLTVEKAWLLSQIGLIPDCDDDVMDEQKWSSCSWLLLREFVKIRQQQEQKLAHLDDPSEATGYLPLPSLPYWRCRQIMTRPDFLEELDRANIISIDTHHEVRPDSMLILHAAREVVEEEGFDDLLDSVRDRVDEIESLHRTRELTFKDIDSGDRVTMTVDKSGGRIVDM